MPEKLRVGIIGVSWAGKANLRAFLAQDDVTVVAISDSNAALLKQVGEEYSIADCYTDYMDIMRRDDIDSQIATATPNFLHEPIVIAAMEHGKHALTEKPLAHTVESAERMVAAAENHNRVLKMVHNQRHYGDVDTLKQYVDDGGVGRIYHAKAFWMRRQGIPGAGNWFSQHALSGGGPLIDLGVHVLDMALYLMNEPIPISVSAAAYAEHGRVGKGYRNPVTDYSKHDVEDFLSAFIRLDTGATITLDVSWSVYSHHGDDFGIAVYGTEGGGEVNIKEYDRDNSLTLFTDVAGQPAKIYPKLPEGKGHEQVARNFVDIIRSGKWENHRGHDALKRTRIVDACYRSAAENKEIRLDG